MKKTYIYTNYCLMADGTTPLASFIFTEDDYDTMVSRYHQDLASAYANDSVRQISVSITYLQITNALGMEKEVHPLIIKEDGFNRVPQD